MFRTYELALERMRRPPGGGAGAVSSRPRRRRNYRRNRAHDGYRHASPPGLRRRDHSRRPRPSPEREWEIFIHFLFNCRPCRWCLQSLECSKCRMGPGDKKRGGRGCGCERVVVFLPPASLARNRRLPHMAWAELGVIARNAASCGWSSGEKEERKNTHPSASPCSTTLTRIFIYLCSTA
jgi:hypothetical protein